ncbi:KH domain-containing protein [Candidatus Gracilibacteria bacterium]|nr:KH domain-containing protein [Candidatus Gracilibacteria bacterium]
MAAVAPVEASTPSPAPIPVDPNNTADQEFVEFVVKQIVENPDEVVVERVVDEMGVLLTLKVAKDDMGKIIGKSGQTAKAIRILLRIIGSKNNSRVNLKIVEPEGEDVV